MTERKFVVRIFDGTFTTVYSIDGYSKEMAEKKIVDYHKAIGEQVVKVTTTEVRG